MAKTAPPLLYAPNVMQNDTDSQPHLDTTLEEHPVSLKFSLDVEDGWPPVAVESLPFRVRSDGYQLLTVPLFVKDLSVGDVIAVVEQANDLVLAWRHVHRSKNTTIWLLRLGPTDQIKTVLTEVRELGCNTSTFDSGGSFAIDLPASVPVQVVDKLLGRLDSEVVAVAYPSLRHPE